MSEQSSTFHGPPESWLQVINEAEKERAGWSVTDMDAIWRHQLSASFQADTPGVSGGTPYSYGQILHDPQCPIDLLKKAKEFAKANMRHPERWMPREIATVLYYATIGAALIHHGAFISQLDGQQLRTGFKWAASQRWLDAQTRVLLRAAVEDRTSA